MGWFAQEVSLLDGAEDFDVMIRRLANSILPLGLSVEETDGDALKIAGITTCLLYTSPSPRDRG